MAILNCFGVVDTLSVFLQPAANLLGLGGQSILVLLSGYLINTYSAIALMLSLDLALREISILSSMILLSHTLPIELSIQKKAGGKIWLSLLIKVGSSIITGLILNLILSGSNEVYSGAQLVSSAESASLSDVLKSWLMENVTILKIFIINIVINVVFKFLIKFHIIDKLSNLLKHIMFLFGLAKEAATYWLVANIVGLIYGAGILITANENNSLEKYEISKLNVSICSMHSLIQETANFLPLGVNILIIIGTCGVCFFQYPPNFANATGRVAYITNVYTRDKYRKQGIATKLLELIMEEIKSRDYKFARLHASSQGKKLYEKIGFADAEGFMVKKL